LIRGWQNTIANRYVDDYASRLTVIVATSSRFNLRRGAKTHSIRGPSVGGAHLEEVGIEVLAVDVDLVEVHLEGEGPRRHQDRPGRGTHVIAVELEGHFAALVAWI
jgi:hypothetical protein